jgi:hypothetical protein
MAGERPRRAMQWDHCPAVERDPQRVSGAWVFRGTRIPVAALFQNPHPRGRFGGPPGQNVCGSVRASRIL